MKITVRQLFILVTKKIVHCLPNSVNQMAFNHLKMFKPVSFVTGKIKVSSIFVVALIDLFGLEFFNTCSSTVTINQAKEEETTTVAAMTTTTEQSKCCTYF
jgi:hypothetical protein